MSTLREVLKQEQGELPVDDWAWKINRTIGDTHRIKISTLYSYLNGNRNVTGKGARSLAIYALKTENYELLDAISQVALGIPYPKPGNC